VTCRTSPIDGRDPKDLLTDNISTCDKGKLMSLQEILAILRKWYFGIMVWDAERGLEQKNLTASRRDEILKVVDYWRQRKKIGRVLTSDKNKLSDLEFDIHLLKIQYPKSFARQAKYQTKASVVATLQQKIELDGYEKRIRRLDAVCLGRLRHLAKTAPSRTLQTSQQMIHRCGANAS